jgi:hypothetical protein
MDETLKTLDIKLQVVWDHKLQQAGPCNGLPPVTHSDKGVLPKDSKSA